MTLRNAKVYETDGVTSNLRILQDGISHVVKRKTTALHLDEDGTDLNIYVPANKDDQDYTFAKALPERLFQWLMTPQASRIPAETSEKGVTAAKAVMSTPRSRITRALEDCGIITTIDIVNQDEVIGEDPASPEYVSALTRARGGNTHASIAGNDHEDIDSVTGYFATPNLTMVTPQQSASRSGGNSLFNPATTFSSPRDSLVMRSQSSILPIRSVPTQSLFDTTYVALLSSVIAAGRRDKLPTRDDFNRPLLQENFYTTHNVFEIGGASEHEKNLKIGAAGELYVGPRSHSPQHTPFMSNCI